MTDRLDACVEALTLLAYKNGKECRWCGRFVGLDHASECPIRAMAEGLSRETAPSTHPPYPLPEDFEAMSDDEFAGYIKRIGFDERIRRALAEPIENAKPTAPSTPEPALDVERLARAIHASHEHPNLSGCLDMDRDTADVLAREYLTSEPRAAAPQTGDEV